MVTSSSTILSNLYVLSRLDVHDKLITEAPRFSIRKASWLTGMIRKVYGESREHAVETLRLLFSAATNVVELAQYRDDAVGRDRMVSAMHNSLSGLDNLAMTYRDDYTIFSQLELLAIDVRQFLSRAEWGIVFSVNDSVTSNAIHTMAVASSTETRDGSVGSLRGHSQQQLT